MHKTTYTRPTRWTRVVLGAAALVAAAAAHASDDKWLGADKRLHFTSSAVAAAAITAATRNESIGFWATVAIGTAKEVWDKDRPNHSASLKDLAWDVAGAYLGAKAGGWAVTRTGGQTVVSFNTAF